MKRAFRIAVWLAMLGMVWSACLPVQAQAGESCAAGSLLEAGIHQGTLEVAGQTRDYLLYTPPSLDLAQPVPVVFSLHGFTSNSLQQMGLTHWNDLADENGFLVVYPQGLGFPSRWNAGPVGNRRLGQADDVSFMRALADEMVRTRCADPARLYVNGMSNGGGMAYRLACEAADVFAAFGGVAGAYSPLLDCNPSRPAPFLFFHGTADPLVPFEGGQGFPDIPAFAADYAGRIGCGEDTVPQPEQGSVSGVWYEDCNDGAEVGLIVIEDGGHTWPGGARLLRSILGETTQDISASAALWAFYQAHALNE
ncbi:MAG: hypothetical protein JNL34_05360 [Anaerolineae bacterium]|nr:hypothetical protein [Anaerolineae bacterium]